LDGSPFIDMDRAKMERSTSVQQEYASFLIRMWHEADPAAPDAVAQWHGEIEHIQSGRQWRFDAPDEIPELLRLSAIELSK
jgi:hypothetical protein